MSLTLKEFEAVGRLAPTQRRRVLAEIGRVEHARCAADPLYWLDAHAHAFPYVYTKDPHQLWTCVRCEDGLAHATNKREIHLTLTHGEDKPTAESIIGSFTLLNPVRPFPIKPYMPPIINTWLNESLFVIEKSRDVMATWLIVALYTWDTIFHAHRQNIFQSKTASDTMELVTRAYHIWSQQPKFLKDVTKCTYMKGTARSGLITMDTNGSEIIGLAQGPDQIRGFHPSGIFQDEAAFQDKGHMAFTASKPAIQNGGRFTAISSPNPSWFMLICNDKSMEETSV